MECSVETFAPLLDRLDAEWPAYWATVLQHAPVRSAAVFGSCAVACGSLGLTNVSKTDLQAVVPLVSLTAPGPRPSVTFKTCGLHDIAVIFVPFETVAVEAQAHTQATGIGHLWPESNVEWQPSLSLTAALVIEVPFTADHKRIRYEQLNVSFKVYGHLSSSAEWPDTESPLFEYVPTDSLVSEYLKALNKHIDSHNNGLRRALQMANALNACQLPADTVQTCVADQGATPEEPCGLCDTCCKCLVQQRCDGPCAGCPCVKCSKSLWTIQTFFISLLLLLVSVGVLWFNYRRKSLAGGTIFRFV